MSTVLLTPAEVAERIGKSERWVKRFAPQLPHRKIGRTVRFTEDDVTEILTACAVRPATPLKAVEDDMPVPIGRSRRRSA